MHISVCMCNGDGEEVIVQTKISDMHSWKSGIFSAHFRLKVFNMYNSSMFLILFNKNPISFPPPHRIY